MKKILWSLGTAVVLCGFGMAAPILPCMPGTFATYVGQTCSVNDQQFSEFAALPVSAGSTALALGEVNVSPITTALQPGLLFTLNVTANPGQLFEFKPAFNVSPLPGGNLINGSILTQNGGTATGNGGVTGIETMCIGVALAANGSCPGSLAFRNLGTFALSGIPAQTSDALTLASNRSLVGIVGDFSVDSGKTGTAAVNSFGIQVTEARGTGGVPEPATVLLMCGGLAAIGCVRRRKRSTAGFGASQV